MNPYRPSGDRLRNNVTYRDAISARKFEHGHAHAGGEGAERRGIRAEGDDAFVVDKIMIDERGTERLMTEDDN
jgi:hypothetical protein